jgi:tetratricopeptide (TPR) repeat protein
MLKLLAIVGCLLGVHSTIIDIFEQTKGHEPRVAINCGKVPFYVDLTTGAWIADKQGQPLCDEQSKETVKKYCQKIYPNLNVTNIVESNKPVIFNNWCKEDNKECNSIKQVVPYRCLVHEYEADALMVPNGCTFDHLHDANKCMSHDEWKVRAKDKCQETDMKLKEYGILLSCGTDKFTGVEFVCCPKTKLTVEKKKKQQNIEKKMKKLLKKEKHGKISQKKLEKKQKKLQKKQEKLQKKLNKLPERKEKELSRALIDFQKFLPTETQGCDRAQFVVKETSMQERHRNRIAAVVEEWDEAEKRYNQLKAKDPVAAEEKMKRTLEVFRETLAALEEEAKEEKSKLRVEHATCINVDISKHKRDAMLDYIDSVEELPANSDRILKAVRKFIQVCEHDRVHSLRHFEHVRNRDPTKAKNMRTELLDHLKDLNTVVNASMSLLNFLPKIAQQFGLGDVGVMLKPRLVMPSVEPIIPHEHEELPDALKPQPVTDNKKPDGTRQPIDELPASKVDEAPATKEVAPEEPATPVVEGPMTEMPKDIEKEVETLGDKDEEPAEFLPLPDEEIIPTKEEFLPKMLGNKDEVPKEFLPKNLLGRPDEVPEKFLPEATSSPDIMDGKPEEWFGKTEEESKTKKPVLGSPDEVPEEFLPKDEDKVIEVSQPEAQPQEKPHHRHHIHDKRSAGFAAVIGLSCGALVIMLGILIALIVRRKRSASHQHVVIPTEENDDQEHLVQMQKKGFENPTYKFYYY